jgi:hypothetical protein
MRTPAAGGASPNSAGKLNEVAVIDVRFELVRHNLEWFCSVEKRYYPQITQIYAD